MENFQMPFGAIEREQKDEDVLLGSFVPADPAIPLAYMPEFKGTIEMQNQTPSCGAHAGQSLKQILESFRGSPEYLWKKMRLVDKLSPNDGSSMLTIMKVLNKTGICSNDLLPNNANVPTKDYADPSPLTVGMDADALNHRIGPYAFAWNPNFQQLKEAIYTHKGAVMLLRVGAEWWTTKNGQGSWQEKDILPLRTDVPITSGHFVSAFAYDEKYIYFVNEWSNGWGRGGIGYFGEDYMPRCVEIGTTVNLNATKYVFIKTLRLASKGYDVKQLQLLLNKLGADLKVDGDFGLMTSAAVEDFQKKHSLFIDGVVGPKTNEVLNSLSS